VDLDSGAVVAAEIHEANQGDTTTLGKTLKATEDNLKQVSKTPPCPDDPVDLVADEGYFSRDLLKRLDGSPWHSRIVRHTIAGDHAVGETMQDFCFKTTDQDTLVAALEMLGLTKDGQVLGDWLYIGRVPQTPGVYDANGTATTPPTYLNGEYAVYRATDAQAAVILGSNLPLGVAIVNPPDGIPLFGGEWLQPDLATLQAEACARIDAAAEALRQTVLTPGTGQMAVYQTKETQARAILQDPEPDETKYPDIYNEIGITADSVQEVAMAVLAAAERWRLFGRSIEKARLAGKKAVNAAVDQAALNAAETAVVWPALP